MMYGWVRVTGGGVSDYRDRMSTMSTSVSMQYSSRDTESKITEKKKSRQEPGSFDFSKARSFLASI